MTTDDKGSVPEATSCPNDTDGDGNCGKPACPHCGRFRSKRQHAPQQDLNDTPVPNRHIDCF